MLFCIMVKKKSPAKNKKKADRKGGEAGADGKKSTVGKRSRKSLDGDAGNKTPGKRSNGQLLHRSSTNSTTDAAAAAAAAMCEPAATGKQQASTNDSSDLAMIDRLIAVQQAGASGLGTQTGTSGGGSALANYAGTTADSFAQSFVDRFAGKMGGVSGLDMPAASPHSPMKAKNTMLSSLQQQQQQQLQRQQSLGSGTDYRIMAMMMEQQQQQVGWRVCAYCSNGAVMSLGELQLHEANCPFRGARMGMGMMASYGQDMMNSMQQQQMQQIQQQQMQQQQMNQSFLGCLPIGTSIPSAGANNEASGMGTDGLQVGGGRGGGDKVAPSSPSSSEPSGSANLKPVSPKKPKATKRDPPLPKENNPEIIENSKGPFRELDKPILLALDRDDYWLTPLHCFVRKSCVEVFTATPNDAEKTPTKGKRRNIAIGQVGIRCPYCHKKGKKDTSSTIADEEDSDSDDMRDYPSRGSIYYPNSINNVYNATMNLLQRHLFFCPYMPIEILQKYTTLKKDDARSGTSKMYWIESAKALGFVDTLSGIKLTDKTPPPPPSIPLGSKKDEEAAAARTSGDDKKTGNAKDDETQLSAKDDNDDASPLVVPEDDKFTKFSFLLMSQMRRCVFTEADRLGKRKGLTNGFAGLACRHCFGGFGAGRFFPSSIKTFSDTSKTLDVIFSHLDRCRHVPKSVMVELTKAKRTHDIERGNMKFGSQKGKRHPVSVKTNSL